MTDLVSLRTRLTALTTVVATSRSNDWVAGQLSPETRMAYTSDLRSFQAWAAARGIHSLADVTRTLLIMYRDELKAQNYAIATIARK